MQKLKQWLGTKKSKAALMAAFFSGLYLAMPVVKPHLPEWLFVALSFSAKALSAFFGGV
ncbi:hypothetical protein L1D52_24020 [Vibrio brasiliensis]|uniref:hypothetical protein n=1 Tax=Vibrio brasiliensis TaxID=170652 RepID=UPI001EFE3649|nr:hypothetical protein [Vibrio brasiliensis]MCG9785379.1 hypothetical protein [Vibrio brasiliensis]